MAKHPYKVGDKVITALGYRARIEAIDASGRCTMLALEPTQFLTHAAGIGDEYVSHITFVLRRADEEAV